MSRTMREITRGSKLRALKAYALRCAGFKHREIAARVGRRDAGLFTNLEFRDRPVSIQTIGPMVQRGARIVLHYYNARRRPVPSMVLRFTGGRS